MVNKKKYYRRQFRLSQEDTEEVDKQIQDMLAADVIELCTSVDYNSCLFTVLVDSFRQMWVKIMIHNFI